MVALATITGASCDRRGSPARRRGFVEVRWIDNRENRHGNPSRPPRRSNQCAEPGSAAYERAGDLGPLAEKSAFEFPILIVRHVHHDIRSTIYFAFRRSRYVAYDGPHGCPIATLRVLDSRGQQHVELGQCVERQGPYRHDAPRGRACSMRRTAPRRWCMSCACSPACRCRVHIRCVPQADKPELR